MNTHDSSRLTGFHIGMNEARKIAEEVAEQHGLAAKLVGSIICERLASLMMKTTHVPVEGIPAMREVEGV